MIGHTGSVAVAGRARRTAAGRQQLAEYYQSLVRRLGILGADADAPLQAVGITSCARREGVSTVALNLAVSAAQAEVGPVLLVDANVTQPSLQQKFMQCRVNGLTDLVAGRAAPEDCIWESPVENLSLLAAGKAGREPAAYDPAILTEMLNALKQDYRLIVFDLPPAHEMTTCFALAGRLDGVLLVIEAERIRSEIALRAKQSLVGARANLLGVVFNKRRKHLPGWLYRML